MKKLLNAAILIAFGILLGGLVWLVSAPPRGASISLRPAPSPAPIQVHVSGAVAQPGLYELPLDARLRDALEAAGGQAEDADLSSLNLAEHLVDGFQVNIPFQPTPQPTRATTGGQGSSAPPAEAPEIGVEADGRININTASQTQLETLPGIGPATAQKIIAYRSEHGPFEIISDIVNVSGIGPSTYDKIKDSITVGEPP